MLTPQRQIITLIKAPEFNLEFLGWLTIIFLILAVIYLFGTFFIRNRIGTNNNRSKDKKLEFSPIISEFLFYEDSSSKEEKINYLNLKVQIRESIKDDFDRKILTEVLLDLRKDLSGQSQTVLIELYKDLELHTVAYKKLSSRRWQVVSSGILELTAMEVLDAYGYIIKFINHRQSTVRKQAERAVVSLKEEGICYFLDNTKYKISEWQQLKLLDVLRHKQDYNPPQFSLWLTSTNTHVVQFSLRLIKYFKQSDAEQSIIILLKHKNRDIQVEAIDCIKEFYFLKAIPTLKLIFAKSSNDVKIEILDTLGEIGSQTDVEFLMQLLKKEKNFNVKNKVISTLNQINPQSILPTKNIKENNYFSSEYTEVELESNTADEQSNSSLIENELYDANEIEENTIVSQAISENLEEQEELTEIHENFDIECSNQIAYEEGNVQIHEIDNSEIVGEQINETPEECYTVNTIDDEQQIDNDPIEELFKKEFELSVDFLPLLLSDDEIESHNSELEIEPMFSLDEDVIFEEKITKNQLFDTDEISLEHIDWTSVTNMETDESEEHKIVEVEPVFTFENKTVSFEANFMNEDNLETMVLLENIADMGDRRELSVLKEILTNNTEPLIIEKTNELIQKFSYQSSPVNEIFTLEHELSDSVFAELINKSDTETKLMLLQEIKKIGDSKEIRLLEYLIENEKGEVARLANKVLDHILSKIHDVILTEDDNSESPIFDLDFGLEIEKIDSQKQGNPNIGGGSTLFDHICSMSSNLYNKING